MNINRRRRALKKCLTNITAIFPREVTLDIEEEETRRKKIWTRDWIKRRHTQGASALLLRELAEEDTQKYKSCLRMSPENFEALLEMVTPKIQKRDTQMRDALTSRVKLEVTLTFLVTGNNYRSLTHLFRVSKTAISHFVPEVCDAIYESLKEYIQAPTSQEQWKEQCAGCRNRWNFPNCCGAIDGKHILIVAPPHCGSDYFNYKGSNSVVLMAVVDANYCFTYVNVGSKGSESDGGIFQNCLLWDALENGLIPDGCYLVGDHALPLQSYLLKPYKNYRRSLSIQEKEFNYRLSRARRIVENAFGILVSRFRIFEKKICLKVSSVNKIVLVSCPIHNWLRKSSPTSYMPFGSVDEENIDTGEIIPGHWRSEIAELRNLEKNNAKKVNNLATKLRDRLKDYFSNEGAVPWQYKHIY